MTADSHGHRTGAPEVYKAPPLSPLPSSPCIPLLNYNQKLAQGCQGVIVLKECLLLVQRDAVHHNNRLLFTSVSVFMPSSYCIYLSYACHVSVMCLLCACHVPVMCHSCAHCIAILNRPPLLLLHKQHITGHSLSQSQVQNFEVL